MRPIDLPAAAALAEAKPHGTRVKYMGGCRCVPCRAANSRYESARLVARRSGDWNGIVRADPARRHLLRLSRAGIGRRTVGAACDVGLTTLQEIGSGRKARIRRRTERRILAVTREAAAGGHLVRADRTWARLRRLMREGFSKAELARRLGWRRTIQLRRGRITARNAMRVERFYRLTMEAMI